MSKKKRLEKKREEDTSQNVWNEMRRITKEDRMWYRLHKWKMRKLARTLSEEEILEYIKAEGRNHLGRILYEYLRKPSERIKLAQVQFDGCDIRVIRNQSDEVKWAAIMETPWAIQYVKNATEDMMIYAVLTEPKVLHYIHKPTNYVKLIGTVK